VPANCTQYLCDDRCCDAFKLATSKLLALHDTDQSQYAAI